MVGKSLKLQKMLLQLIENFQFSDKELKSDEVNLLIFKNIAEIA